jgi:hypothetical protein
MLLRGINNLEANQIVLRRGFGHLGVLAFTGTEHQHRTATKNHRNADANSQPPSNAVLYQSVLRLTLVVMARLVRASEHASEGTYSSTCRDRWPGHAGP